MTRTGRGRKKGDGIILRNKAFTLIELVIVVVIIAIIAVAAMPAIIKISGQAKVKADDATIAALKTAIYNEHLKYALEGQPNYWPKPSNPFDLLNPPPKARPFNNQPSNGEWQYLNNAGITYWLVCPHYSGSSYRVYIYTATGVQAGDVSLSASSGDEK